MRWILFLLTALLLGGGLGTLTHAPPCRAGGEAAYCRPGVCFGNDCGRGCRCVIPPGSMRGQCWGVQ